MYFAKRSKDTQKKKSVVKLSINTPYKPRYEKKNQLKITEEKNNVPKKKYPFVQKIFQKPPISADRFCKNWL